MIGIYQILCTTTNEIYIGSSINIASRKAGHLYCLRNNRHPNPILQSKYNFYGEKCFTFSILEVCIKSNLLEREQFYLDSLKPKLNCNMIAGRPPKMEWTKESRDKMSKSKKGIPHKNKRKYTKNGLRKIRSNNRKLFLSGKLGGIGSSHPGAALIEEQVLQIKEYLEENILEIKQIANMFNVTYACIADIKYNRSWNHLRSTKKVDGRSKIRSLTYEERLIKSLIYSKFNNKNDK